MKKIILISSLFFIGLYSYGQDILMQDGTFTQCSGSFFDSGGSTMQYGNNEDFTITICPTTNPSNIRLDFSAFVTQPGQDIMTIFDGDDDTAPVLGMFDGNNSPGVIQASDANPSGCLTINFTTNGNGRTAGWEAAISCVAACQAITAILDSSVPALQASGAIIADPNEAITFNGSGTFSVDGTGATYTWDFGDGNTATGQTVTHTYTTAGLFTVTLTIEDTAGCFNQNDIGVTAQIGSSSPGNPFVDAGDDVDLDCDVECTTLSASFLDIGDTSTYTVSSIPFVPPFAFSGLSNSVNTNVDDRWDAVRDLIDPNGNVFEFCFFNDLETQFQVGSNGVIRFDVDPNDTSNDFNPSNIELPSNADPALSEANIFTPLHDIDPSVGDGSDEIAWEIIGTAPNRVLAVSFFNVPMWTCNTELATHMAVFYETTNVIDIYVQNAPFCNSWNNNKVIGIQNDAGTEAFVPPGRNTNEGGGWTTTDEAWRFTPAGPTIIDFAWLDENGDVLSTDINFEVCPTAPSTTYTAQVTYNTCTGMPEVISDTVTVTTNSPFIVDLGPDITVCDSTTSSITLDAGVGIATATYQWQLNGVDISGATNPTLDVVAPNSGIYSVTVTDSVDSCVSTDEIEINFVPSPTANFVEDQLVCDDNNDGFANFDFSLLDATIIGTQTNVEVTYHSLSADAASGANPLPNPYTNVAANTAETIFVRIQVAGDDTCFDTSQFQINVFNTPMANPIVDQLICDDDNDGFSVFDFNALRLTILGTQAATDYTVSFHPTAQDALDGTADLPDMYTNMVAFTAETIFVRVENNLNDSCIGTTDFVINVFETPTANPVADQILCDDDGDGFLDFDFTLFDADVLLMQPAADFTVTYHNTLADAQSGTSPIMGLYTNATANTAETIFVRIENNTNTTCADTTDFTIDVINSPEANMVDDQLICDDNNDGFWNFDLDALRPTILGTQSAANVSITFHPTAQDAIDGTADLPDMYMNANAYTAETIFVRVEDNTNPDCIGQTDFVINVFNSPTANTVAPQLQCDDDNDGFFNFDFSLLDDDVLGIQSNTEFTVSYHNSLIDAQNGDNPIVGLYINATAFTSETIFVRIENSGNSACAATTQFDINVFATPIANAVDDQLICDDNNDGFWDFDLDALRATVFGAQSDVDNTVSFHNSLADAQTGASPLPNIYTNVTPYAAETIFVRIQNNANTPCFSTTDFEIDVFNDATANIVAPQLICDDDDNGLWAFDLDALDAIALDTQLATEFNVSYHSSMADADAGTPELASPYTNQTPYAEETIYVRVENADNPACFEVSTFIIDVFNGAEANTVEPQLICDPNNDGFWDFDLDALRATVLDTQNATEFTVSFHSSQADADNDFGPLPDVYTNAMAYTEETIFVRIENNDNNLCSDTDSFIIDVFNSPIANTVMDQVFCDDDNDGFWNFDLDGLRPTILGTQSTAEFNVSFHTSQANADNGSDPLPNTYQNSAAFTAETIFIRVENNENTECADTSLNFEINVFETPTANMVEDQLICDTDNDGLWIFDFDALRATVLDTQSAADFTVSFHATLMDAQNDANALPDNYQNQIPYVAETIFVRIENNGNQTCIDTNSFEIDVFNGAVANEIDDQPVCDEDGDGFEEFNLDALRTIALGTQLDTEYSVSFHDTQADAQTGNNPLPDLYTNADAFVFETIFVRVESNTADCFDTSTFELQINSLPEASVVIEDFTECENDTDMIFDFDLESKNEEILNGQDPIMFTVTYHISQDHADNLTNPLASPYENTSNPQPIFVAITNNNTGCSVSTLSFNIEVLDGSSAEDDFYELCDVVGDNDGSTQFDLNSRIPNLIGMQDPDDVIVSFHFSEEDAIMNENPLPFLYENLTNPQIVYVRVSNSINPDECFDVSELTLQTNLLPIFDLEDEYTLCLTSNDEAVVDVPPVIDTQLSTAEYSFEWSFNGELLTAQNDSFLIPTEGGTYSVLVTNNTTGCNLEDTTEVIESGIPDTFDVEITSQAFTGNNMIIATAEGNSTYEFSLDLGPWQLSGEFNDVSGGDHTVYVRDINGCGILSRDITVIDYPKFFTPNGDGNNDTWTIRGIDTQPTAIIYIHDRYGKLLKQLSPTSAGWDGTYNGNNMPSSDYWFTLQYTEPTTGEVKSLSAHFALKR